MIQEHVPLSTATFGLIKVCAQNLNKLMQFCSNQKMSCLIFLLLERDHALWIFFIWSIFRWLGHFNQFLMGKMYIIFLHLTHNFARTYKNIAFFVCVSGACLNLLLLKKYFHLCICVWGWGLSLAMNRVHWIFVLTFVTLKYIS